MINESNETKNVQGKKILQFFINSWYSSLFLLGNYLDGL